MSSPNIQNTIGGGAFIGQAPVAGATSTVYTQLNDYTSAEVAQEYYNNFAVIQEFFNRVPTTPANANIATDISPADAANIAAALQNLLTLAQNGITTNIGPNSAPVLYFLTNRMATTLDLLVRSFQAAGAATPWAGLTVANLANWKDLSVVSPAIQNIMQAALYATAGNRSIQSIIELDYVATGNNLINDKLSKLEDALTITQSVLDSLANLQNIRNLLVVTTPTGYTLPPSVPGASPGGGTASQIVGAYRPGASAFFNQKIFPRVNSQVINSGGTLTTYGVSQFNNLLKIQQSLLNFLPQLAAITDTTANPNSLLTRLQAVVHDFSVMFTNSGVQAANLTSIATQTSALRLLLLDNNDPAFQVTGRSANEGQGNLTFAVTAAQGLNDQQKQEVQQFLFVFEEFYKSASAVLQSITKIIERMAQNIAR